MATLQNQFIDDEDDKDLPPTQPAPATGGGVVGAGGVATPSASPDRKSRAGGFVGIQNYLGAQGNAGGRLAENVSSNIGAQTEAAKSGIGAVSQNFGTQAETGRTGGSQELSGQLMSDPTKINQGAWQKATGGYQGPTDIGAMEGYGQAAGDAQRAQQAIDQTASAAGQSTLLKDQFGRPSYTGGQNRLDTAILGASQGSRERFAGLRDMLGGQATTALSDARAQADALSGQYTQEGIDTGAQLRSDLAGERTGLQTGMQTALDEQRAAELANYQGIMGEFGTGAMSAANKQQLKDLGLSATTWDKGGLTQAQKSDLLKLRQSQKFADVASEQQIARDSALSRLAGKNAMIQGTKGQTGLSFDEARASGMRESNLKKVQAQKAKQAALYDKFFKDQAAKKAAEDAAFAKTKGGQAANMDKQLSSNAKMKAQIEANAKQNALAGMSGSTYDGDNSMSSKVRKKYGASTGTGYKKSGGNKKLKSGKALAAIMNQYRT